MDEQHFVVGNYVISVINCLLKERTIPAKPSEITWQDVHSFSSRQGVLCYLYYALKKYRDSVDAELYHSCRTAVYSNALCYTEQLNEAESLFAFFEENNIQYLPIKGVINRELYPSNLVRSMGDVDVLIQEKDHTLIKNQLISSGYSFILESDHEYVYEKLPYMRLELHKCLFGEMHSKTIRAYFFDIWDKATSVSAHSCRFVQKLEDRIIYEITHIAKHYAETGIGLRHFIDIELLTHASTIDHFYIKQELKKLGLWNFANNVLRLIKVWFSDGTYDELTEEMALFIFSGGSFGKEERRQHYHAVRAVENSNNVTTAGWRLLMNKIVPPRAVLARQYPILWRHSYLYPVILPIKWVTIIVARRKSIITVLEDTHSMDAEQILLHENHCKKVGIAIRDM